MAHRGQEGALGLVRVVGFLARFLQLHRPARDAVLQGVHVLAQLGGHGVEGRGQGAHLVLRGDARYRLQVARGHPRGGPGQRQDGSRQPTGDDPDADRQQQGGQQPHEADGEGQRACRAERLVLADLGHQAGAPIGQPAIDPDDRHTPIVEVQTLAICSARTSVMPVEIDGIRRRAGRGALDEPVVGTDQVGPPRVTQTGPLGDDPVHPLQAQVRGQHRHSLAGAVLVEQGRRHGHGRQVGEGRRVHVLDRRVGGAILEEWLACL